jgi:glycosyltransferase involved in cell wall biosynthesis
MKISGFSYVRNGFDYGVPFMEAIQSVLPVCDELIVAVGDSNDGTREAIVNLRSDKIKIIDTVWNMSLTKGGKIFAQQSNIGLDAITGDWAFHIQADEVISEKDIFKVRQAIEKHDADTTVEGFILPFLHFWGGYDHIRTSRRVHNYEVRVFRNRLGVRSYGDSQGFRKYSSKEAYESGREKGEKLHVKIIDATIFHYNGIRPPQKFQEKADTMGRHYQADHPGKQKPARQGGTHDRVDRAEKFTGAHPAIMMDKVNAQDWEYVFDPSKAVWVTKDRFIQPIEDLLGFKIGEYKNYKLLRPKKA